MAGVRYIGSIGHILRPPTMTTGGLYHVQNLVGIDAVASIIRNCQYFARLA